jgi:ribose 5-phosphate isomerase B
MRIAIGSDHRGLALKELIKGFISGMGHQTQDFGAYDDQRVDYPDIALAIGKQVSSGQFDYGILICGTGLGMSIAANKVKGIRAALCCDAFMAERARRHNDANILCLGAEREIDYPEIVRVFLSTNFDEGRHQQRLKKIKKMEDD